MVVPQTKKKNRIRLKYGQETLFITQLIGVFVIT